MGSRFGRTQISSSNFLLIPGALEDVSWTVIDDVTQEYKECHRIIFDRNCSIKFEDEEANALTAAARNLACSLKVFILTVMWTHQQVNFNKPFFKQMILSEGAKRRVSRYQQEVAARYGIFNYKTLSDYSTEGIADQSTEDLIISGETLAGHWILGYKIRKSGQVIESFLDSCEYQLPILWLALTQEYYPRLTAKSLTSPELAKHRAQVSKLVVELKRDKRRAINLFKIRQKIMPRVIEKVLAEKGFDHSKFKSSESWSSTILFWSRLALAVQQAWCWEYLIGNTSLALKQLKSGEAA